MSDFAYFQFEADFVESLRCIPMVVRCKLDTCGIKLKLDQWNRFELADRQELAQRPCEQAADIEAYRIYLTNLIHDRAQAEAKTLDIDPNPSWLDETQIPEALLDKVSKASTSLSLEQWRSLSPLQRFALIKLSQPSHESHNFLPALREFGLLGS